MANNRFSAAEVSSGPDKSPLKTIITGGPGVGKTYFVSTIVDKAGGPIFFLPVEEGAKGLCPDASPQGFRVGDRWITPRALPEFYDACDEFLHVRNAPVDVTVDGRTVKRRPYRHFGVDSLTGLERMVHETACGIEGAAHLDEKDFKKVWGAAMPVWSGVQNKLDEIRRSGVNIWLIAHATETFDASQTTGDVFKKWDLMVRGSGKTLEEVRHFWRAWADSVFFISRDVTVAKGDKTKRAMARLGGRLLITQETGSIYAKSRLAIPAKIPATWRDLQAAIEAGTPAKVDKTREQVATIVTQLEPEDRASIEADLASAKTPTQIAAVLSRAQGMLAMLDREDEEDPAPPAGVSAATNGAAAKPLTDEAQMALSDAGEA